MSILPKQLRTEWENKTESSKAVPDIFEWIEFVRQKSSNAGYEQKPTSHPPLDSKRTNKVHIKRESYQKQKAAVHTSAAPPPPAPVQSPTRQNHHDSRSSAPKNNYYSGYRYQCILCHDYHPLFACSSFGDLTVQQRKEHVKTINLCWNCLGAGHKTSNCRCQTICRHCDGKHHSMIHQDRAESPAHPQAAALHTAASQPTSQIPSSLLMTSQVMIRGPTGKTLVMRALLDSGATFTLISTKAMNTLKLPRSNTHITIKGVQNSNAHSLTNFTLSPVQNPEKTYHISAAVVPEVTCNLPLQGAATVKQLPHIRELQLADPQFHSPGRIDLVLGENILDKLLLPREVRTGPEGTPSAWSTVFGWAIRGFYTPGDSVSAGQAAAHLAITNVVDDSNQTLTKFWEVEEPPQLTSNFTPEEITIQEH